MTNKIAIKHPENITEKQVEKEIRDALKAAGIWHFKHWGNMYSRTGIPDLIGCYPAKVEDLVKAGVEEIGIFLAIEVKRPGRVPDKDQEEKIKEIKRAKGIGFWADSSHKVIKYLGLTKKAYPLFQGLFK